MNTAKQEVQKILNMIPDSASFEQIQYHIYVCQKVEKGLADIREGRVIDHSEVAERMGKWVKP